MPSCVRLASDDRIPMKRRRFIQTSASLLALTTVTRLAAGTQAYTHPDLLSFVGDRAYVHQLGLAYRNRFPEEANSTLLGRLLQDNINQLSVASGSGLQNRLNSLVMSDFARGDTVLLDGWVLARTEARQCALCTLQDN